MGDVASISLLWLPLGAGGSPVVRASGRLYEHLVARRAHRHPCDLYHSALMVRLGSAVSAVEMAPAWSRPGGPQGAVARGAVGSRLLGGSRWFRYEVRCCPGGTIPDEQYAAGDPVDVATDPARTRRLLVLAPAVPTPVWGRDELGTGEMWNCNSAISWLLASSGHDVTQIRPPPGGRAPGWHGGLMVALRGERPDLR